MSLSNKLFDNKQSIRIIEKMGKQIMHMHSHTNSHADSTLKTAGFVIRWARLYDPLVQVMTMGQAARLRQQSVALATVGSGDTVLDVGCGTGDLALVAASHVGVAGQVYGIDPAPEMIGVAERKAVNSVSRVEFRCGLIEALPYADKSVDVVLSSLMMHHLPATTKEEGLAEIKRVLRPKGRLLIVDFKRPTSNIGKTVITALLHGGLQIGVQDLAQPVTAAGFTVMQQGNTALWPIGYLLAEKPSE